MFSRIFFIFCMDRLRGYHLAVSRSALSRKKINVLQSLISMEPKPKLLKNCSQDDSNVIKNVIEVNIYQLRSDHPFVILKFIITSECTYYLGSQHIFKSSRSAVSGIAEILPFVNKRLRQSSR